MLNWANRFNICCFLNNNNYPSGHHSVECLLGAGAIAKLQTQAGTAFDKLSEFADQHNDWIFGHLGYDLKNETENFSINKTDRIGFDDMFFFVPKIVIELNENTIRIGTTDESAETVFNQILGENARVLHQPTNVQPTNVSQHTTASTNDESSSSHKQKIPQERKPRVDVQQRYNRDEYLQTIRQLQQHILRGDCYEINFCQEFYAERAVIDPLATYDQLTNASPNPFSAYYRVEHSYLLCASPERYLKKKGRRVISQPIKGTLRRSPGETSATEAEAAAQLYSSAKDRSENVMVVDLVRNDLSRLCAEGSVVVDELFGIYTFPQVYQMISTISGELKSEQDWLEVIRLTFPMGSMTGAPKRSVLELIDRYERSRRGLFSGAVGYISPERDFDFNVVIRSILYNQQTGYLSFPAGSGITFYSDPESEYEECLVKAAAIRNIIENA